jgi:hypothetical protein
MLHQQASAIDEPLLNAVCAEHWSESQTLDFKRSLPGTEDKAKHEFLKDVAAFANASGGDLVFGIQESAGHADHIVPIQIAADPIDATKRRLGQVLDGGLEPRVDGVVMHAVPVKAGGYVLIVRVPASFQRPHRSRVANHWQWPVRAETHIVDLTYDQIRDAFDRSATIAERARRFRDERLTGVLTGTTGRPLRAGPRLVVHLIPLASIAGKASPDVRTLYHAGYQEFMFPDWGGATRSFNLDGLVVYPGKHAAHIAYTQVFRTGAMETVRWVGSLHAQDKVDQETIPSGVASGLLRDALTKFLAAAGRWNIAGPAIAAAALLDIGKFQFWYQPRGYFTQRNASDRSNIILPEVWIEELSAVENPDTIARPLLDTLWQSFDMERCAFYDAHDNWAMH